MSLALFASCVLAAAAPQETDAERLRRLEEQLKKQQAEIDALKKSAPAPEADVTVSLAEGLIVKSRDGAFSLHVGGRLVLHGRSVFDRPDDDEGAPRRSLPDALFFREAYLEAEGAIYKEFGFKVQADFRTGTANQTTGADPAPVQGSLRDGFLRWQRWPELRVRLGQFYEPVSQEDQTSFRFIDFAERSVMNRLLTGREIGLEVSGAFEEGLVAYAVMFAQGASLLGDQGRSVSDREDEKQLAGALHVMPLRTCGVPWLEGLRLSVGGSVEDVDSVPAARFDLATTELSILWLDSTTGGDFDGRRTRLVPQFSWALGPVLLRGEYLVRRDELDDSFAEDELRSGGWYAYATWLVTGETKKPETRVVPAEEGGAVELAFRAAKVRVAHPFAGGLASPAGNTDEVLSLTAGVNWWLQRNLRFTLNVVRERYEDELDFDTRSEDSLVGVLFRAQVDF